MAATAGWMIGRTPAGLIDSRYSKDSRTRSCRKSDRTSPPAAGPLMLMPTGWRAAVDSGALSPLMSKVFQESDLRDVAGRVFVNPSTAASAGVTSGGRALVRTRTGSATVTVIESETVMPGVISGVVGPLPNGATTKDELDNDDILALCDLQEDGTWRVTRGDHGQGGRGRETLTWRTRDTEW